MEPAPKNISDDLNAAPRCLRCGYPLIRLTDRRCPECGNPFDLADPTTFRPPPKKPKRDRTIQEILVLLFVSGILASDHDVAEAEFEFVLETVILFSIALYFAVTNDKFWLSPVLFFVAFVGISCWYYWLVDWPLGKSPLIRLALVVGFFGAISLASIKGLKYWRAEKQGR